jgi:hypothetical protein
MSEKLADKLQIEWQAERLVGGAVDIMGIVTGPAQQCVGGRAKSGPGWGWLKAERKMKN